MNIGILETGRLDEGLERNYGNFPQQFSALLKNSGFAFKSFAVLDGEFPSSLNACDGYLITGSRHAAYDEFEWIRNLEDFIRRAYDAEIPMVGICFGHQVIAKALGGKVEKYKGGWGIGHQEYVLDGNPVQLLAMHQDQVTQLPDEAEVIGSSQFCENAALSYKGKALSYQPHPEFTPQFTRDLIINKIETGLDAKTGAAALEKVEDEYDSPQIADEITRFFIEAQRERQQAAQ